MREEERIRKEREQIEMEFKREEDKKKAKFNEIQQANAQIMQAKNNKKQVVDDPPMQNFISEKKGKVNESFNRAITPIQQEQSFEKPAKRNSQMQFEGFQQPANPQIS